MLLPPTNPSAFISYTTVKEQHQGALTMHVPSLGKAMRKIWRPIAQWLLAFAVLTPTVLIGPATPASVEAQPVARAEKAADSSLEHVDPRIVEVALQAPEQMLRVIVQKMATDQQLEQMVSVLGGNLLSDLSIINAFAAEMSAEATLQLARNPNVRWISIDGQVQSSLLGLGGTTTPDPLNTYLQTLNIPELANSGLDGKGIGVAVIDSGVAKDPDFTNLAVNRGFNLNSVTPIDLYGHGTHIAGIVAGNGRDSSGKYKGIAPGVTLIGLKVSNDLGLAFESDVVKALQWTYEHKSAYNIRVINLSINSGVDSSYQNSPLNAAAEILWFSGVVVVVSAGNSGGQNYNTVNAPPANDPFLITVGASDEMGTAAIGDDMIAPYSAYGRTQDGFVKPDIVAPGTGIYSVRAALSPWPLLYPDRLAYKGQYFRLSGTSMAAPMVVGVVALMLQDEPQLTPDQVKYRLIHSTNRSLPAQLEGATADFPYMDGAAAVNSSSTESANTGLTPSQLLWTGSSPVNWSSVNWNSVNWNSVNWNSVNWNSVNWNSVNWNSAVLEPPRIRGILPLAEGDSWEVPLWAPTTPEAEPDTPDLDHALFLPALGQ